MMINQDMKLYMRMHPKWYLILSRYPEELPSLIEHYKLENKLTIADRIEKVGTLFTNDRYVIIGDNMYKQIDELINAILKDDIYKNYQIKEQALYNQQLISLLSKQQILQEDYLRLRQYQNYVSCDDTKKELQKVKKEIFENSTIQTYYQSYYQLNELLDAVTKIVFQGISEDIVLEKWK